ncbi:MAG TPA: choice-of-anchor Q domain-containing protein [Pyrinomonadaceae bacterium]|nr:choice-of-anchor Q domain-containing protein [Pyrinomonadaceae bacterium]
MRFARRIFLSFWFILCFALAASAATYTVTKTADTNDGACDTADCSLREAIAAANATTDNDVIMFAPMFSAAPQTITLSGTDLQINNNGTLTVTGPGANRLTVSGNNQSRIFTNNVDATTTISGMRLTGGNGASTVQSGRAGAVYNNDGFLTLESLVIEGNSAANGGGLNNAGGGSIMTIRNSVIANNTATGAGGAMQNFSTSTLHLINTTVNNNTCNSTLTGGGGIQANGMLTMSNVTFSGNNAAGGDGGAIYYNGTGFAMNNVTVANNTASGGGSGGLHKSTSTLNANVRNSIFANNTGSASPDVTGAISSQGNNIIRTVGTSTGWVASDQQNVDPLLGPLGYYGSDLPRRLTHALYDASPAVNAGNNCVIDMTCATGNTPVALTTDERGAARVGSVDIGAYEVNNSYVAVLPNAFLQQEYNFTLIPNLPSGNPFVRTSGAQPPGIVTANGPNGASLNGTPTESGTFNFTMTYGVNLFSVNYSLTVVNNLSSASVGGRVTTSGGAAVPNAIVVLTDSMNNTRYARTNGFGYFRFDNVPTNQTYTATVVSKQYQFQPQTISVTDNVTNLNFTAEP